jgi:hypothetical protein
MSNEKMETVQVTFKTSSVWRGALADDLRRYLQGWGFNTAMLKQTDGTYIFVGEGRQR